MIAEALRDLIKADAVADSLATFEFTTGTPSPAIFTTPVIPEDCELPAVLIEESGRLAWGTNSREGMEALAAVRVVGNRDRETSTPRDIARDVWKLLNRAGPTISGYETPLCLAEPPQFYQDEDGYPAWVINVRLLVLEDEP